MEPNFEQRSLGDCAKFFSGGTPSKSNPDYWVGSIPWVSCKDMKVPRLYDAEDHLSEEGCKNGTRLIQPGTILIVVRGMILAKEFPVAMAMREVAFNQDLKALCCNDGVDSWFLYFWLLANSYEVRGLVDEAAHGTKRLQSDRLLNLQVNLPPLNTQRKIAFILSAYDDLIENNTRRIKILEQMAQMIYREWFVNFRFPGHEQVKLVDSPCGLIPEGWEVKPVTEAVEVSPRTKVPTEGEKHFVPMGSLSNDSMLVSDVETRSGNSGSKFQNGDTLFARITPCLENGKTGYVQFLPGAEVTAFGSTEFIVLRSKTLCPEYVYLMARSSEFRDNAIKSMSGATGRQRVREKCFDQFFITQPDAVTLEKFSCITTQIFKQIQVLAKKNQNLRQTRDLLLPKLISGEIDFLGENC